MFAEIRFEITPPSTPSDLLVTITFNEKAGGFLKAFWDTAEGFQTLSDNLYEGIAMPNQRSLLISQLMLKEKGTITFQASQEDAQIYKIQWEWLESKVISASEDFFGLAAVSGNGKALEAEEVNGEPFPAPVDQWKGSFMTAVLTDEPERIEEGLEFQADMEKVPAIVRLEGWVSGLSLDKALTLWINGVPVAISPEVPNLTDPGYQILTPGKFSYVGWRKVQLWISPDWLQTGVNKFQFSWESDSSLVAPVAVKNLSLQLYFSSVLQPSTEVITLKESAALP